MQTHHSGNLTILSLDFNLKGLLMFEPPHAIRAAPKMQVKGIAAFPLRAGKLIYRAGKLSDQKVQCECGFSLYLFAT